MSQLSCTLYLALKLVEYRNEVAYSLNKQNFLCIFSCDLLNKTWTTAKPYHLCHNCFILLSMRIAWSTVSNAFFKSRNNIPLTNPLSTSINHLFAETNWLLTAIFYSQIGFHMIYQSHRVIPSEPIYMEGSLQSKVWSQTWRIMIKLKTCCWFARFAHVQTSGLPNLAIAAKPYSANAFKTFEKTPAFHEVFLVAKPV